MQLNHYVYLSPHPHRSILNSMCIRAQLFLFDKMDGFHIVPVTMNINFRTICKERIFTFVEPCFLANSALKGQFHEILDFRLSTWINLPPKPLIIPFGPFQIFRSSRCTTGVVDTGGKWKISSTRKIIIIISYGHLWVVEIP